MTTPHDDRSRAATHAAWLDQIDGCLQRGDYPRAQSLLSAAEREFPGDADLAGRRRVVTIAFQLDPGLGDRTMVRPAPAASPGADATRVIPGRRAAPSPPAPNPSDDRTIILPRRNAAPPALAPIESLPSAFTAPPPTTPAPTVAVAPALGAPTARPQPAPRARRPLSARPAWLLWGAVGVSVIAIAAVLALVLWPEDEPLPVQTTVTSPPPLPPPIQLPPAIVPEAPPPAAVPEAPAPPPVVQTPRTPQPAGRPAAPPTPLTARLALAGLAPGTRVMLDGEAIGDVAADGTLTLGSVAPGPHRLRFERPGHEPLSLSREFAAGGLVRLSASDVALKPSPARVQFQADADASITVKRDGRTVQQFRGSSEVTLEPGTYTVEGMGPAGVPLDRPLSVTIAPGESRTIEVRTISGMERFAPGWAAADGWFTRRGGGFVIYDRTNADGAYAFSVQLDRRGNPFSSGSRLGWVVGYIDDRNYVRFQIDTDNFYRTEFVSGRSSDTVRIPHRIPTGGAAVRLLVQVSTTRVTHQYSVDNGPWQTFDDWMGLQLKSKRFGFQLTGSDQVTISGFQFRPAAR